MKKTIFILSFFLFGLFCVSGLASIGGFAKAKNDVVADTEPLVTAKSALLVDSASGNVIFEKDADRKLPIASMTKLVGLGVVLEALDEGKLGLDQKVTISQEAASMEGSEAFLDANNQYKIEDLIKTVVISSANDSMVALAECGSGSEKNFVRKMNEYANKIGMENSNFSNSTGLPCADHFSTARDMIKVYEKVKDHGVYKKFASVWIDELVHPSGRKTQLVNTNRLIRFYKGTTGGKTGFTNEAGFCLTASAKRHDMELIAVVMGESTSKDRFASVTNMFDFGFNNFENRVVVKKGDKICETQVKNSTIKKINGYAKDDFVKFLKKGDLFEYQTAVEMNELKAPFKEGEKIGSLLILDQNNIVTNEIDIVSGQDVDEIKIGDIVNKIYNNW